MKGRIKMKAMFGARTPLDVAFVKTPKGEVHVLPERCKGCGFCIAFCPAHVLAFSPDHNEKGYHFPVVADGKETSCINCGFCSIICPDMAIYTFECGVSRAELEFDASPDQER